MFLLVPAYPGSPGQKALKRLCVCVCVGHIDMQTYVQFLQSTFGFVLGLLFVYFY